MRFSLILLAYVSLFIFASISMAETSEEGKILYWWSAVTLRQDETPIQGTVLYEIKQGEEVKTTENTSIEFVAPSVGTSVCITVIEVLETWEHYGKEKCSEIIAPPKETQFRTMQIIY